MISPVYRNIFLKKIPSYYKTAACVRNSSVENKMAQPRWLAEKENIMVMKPEEKRKRYKVKDVLRPEEITTWSRYILENKEIEAKKHTLDDLTEWQKNKFDASLNKSLADKVSLFRGDITRLEVDAIVNAANSMLRAGGGVDGAIHRAAGHFLQEECNTLGGCPTGDAKITGGYDLPARYIIHTVGPQDGKPSMLESCYKKCFSLQKEYSIRSFAFPCISTGIYGFPNRLAAHIALRTARKALEENPNIVKVIFCTFMQIDVDIYQTLMQMYFPVHQWNYNDGAAITDE